MATRTKILICAAIAGLTFSGMQALRAQDTADYFLGHGFAGTGDTVFTNSGYFWDDGYDTNYDANGDWHVYFCTTEGNTNPLTMEFTGFATHYGGGTLPGPYHLWDYMIAQFPGADYRVYHDDTPEFSLTSQDGCIHITMVTNGDALTHNGWSAEIYAIPPPPNNEPCGAAFLQVGNVCTPQVFSNKGAYQTAGYASPCHDYFGGDIWFTAVVPPSGNLKIESFPGTLDWAVMNLYRGGSCSGLTHFDCIEDSIGMPTANLDTDLIPGLSAGDTVYIRMFGDQAKSGTFGMCASDPVAEIEGHTGPGGVGDDSTNVIWLRADKGTLNSSDADAGNGEGVKTWMDQSGNSNHMVQSTAALQPLLTNNIIDAMPVLRYDGTDDFLMAELSSLSAPLTLVAVGQFSAGGTDQYMMSMGDEISAVKTVSISRETDNRYYTYTDAGRFYGPTLTTSTPYLIHAVHNISSAYHELYINESSQSADDYSTPAITDGSLRLGADRNTSAFLQGDIAEFIVYKQKLNAAQKIIVENFLAAKYGLGISSVRYAHVPSHKYDVAGIGQLDADNQHTEAQSAAALSIGNPTDLDDGEYLLFGHDNGDLSAWTTTERPNNDPDVQRIAREWMVDITGDPGALTITLSDSTLPDLLPGFDNYTLWTDPDGDFSSGATAVPLVMVDGNFVANSVTLADDSYLTVGAVMPVVGFTQDSSEALESVEFPDIELSLNFAVNEEISVVFRAIDGTAAGSGTDYLLNPGSATFPAGSTTVNIQPQILEDTIVEIPDEYFHIRLSDPDPGLTLSADSNHTYTILNNDINVSVSTDTDTISDCGLVSANLSSTVEGTGPFSYLWTPSAGLNDAGIPDPEATPVSDTWYILTVTDLTNGSTGKDSIHITVVPKPSKPSVTPGGSTTFCEGDSVMLTASSGHAWLWSNGKTAQDIWVSMAGDYTVGLIDEFGCESDLSDAVSITVNTVPGTPLVTASGPTDICPGDSISLSSSVGDNYLWSTGATSKTIWVKSAGDYYVRTESSEGCISDTSLITSVTLKSPPPAPTVTASGSTDLCPGDSVELEASPASTWLWSNGDSTRSIMVKNAGSYNVRITDATGCFSPPSPDTDVTVRTPPATPDISPGGPTDLCPGDSVDLEASPAAGWLWSTGDTSRIIRVKTAGSYSVQVSDAAGCWSASSSDTDVTVKTPPSAPTISPSGATDICPGDSVDLDAGPASSWLWSSGDTIRTIRVKTAGGYTVRITDASGCWSPASAETSVSLKTPPATPTITASGATDLCPGDSVDLEASPADSWLWSSGDTSQTIRIKTAGNYSVQVRDASTCLSDSSATTVITILAPPAPPVITPAGSTDICENDSVSLSSSPGNTYSWSSGDSTASIYAKAAGSYTVRIRDAAGCWSASSAPVAVTTTAAPPRPSISLSGDSTFCPGDSLVMSTTIASSYEWSSGQSTQEITVHTAGSYFVRIANASGCFSLESAAINVSVHDSPPVPLITGDSAYCAGDSVDLATSAAASYSWSTGDTTATISVRSGTYIVSITDANGCESPLSDPHTVTENPLPPKPSISGDERYCQGDSVQLSAPEAAAYEWSTGETTRTIYSRSGSFTLRITDAMDCRSPASDMHLVTEDPLPAQPVISAGGPLEFWYGDSVVLSSSPSPEYLWFPGAETTAEITVKDGGDYSIVVTDANGCVSVPSDPVTVRVNALIKPVITASGETGFCMGDSILLSTEAAARYEWSTGETTQTVTVSEGGSYSVRVYDAEGHGSELSDPVIVTVHPVPVLSLVSRADVNCKGGSTGAAEVRAALGTGPYSFLWPDQYTGLQASGLAAGIYRVTVSDVNACSSDLDIEIREPEAILITETLVHPSCNDSYDGSILVVSSGGIQPHSVSWSDGSSTSLLEDLGPGSWEVTVSDSAGCTQSESFSLLPLEDFCVTVPGIITPNDDGYNDTWRLPGIEYYPDATVEVYDRWGKQVFYSESHYQPWDGKYDGKLLPMASYHYIIKLNNGGPPLIGNITILK